MNVEAWLAVVGILVTLALALCSAVVGLVGWFLSRMITATDKRIQHLENDNIRKGLQITRLETVLDGRGILPKTIKYPSPPPRTEETA